MIDFKTNILICDCNSSQHQLLIRYFEDDVDSEVYVETHLAKKPLLDRLIYGIKYIFGYQSRFGAFDEVILGPQHINSLQSVIDHIKQVEAKKLQTDMFNGR
jgi:hypothetical protein